MKLSLATTSLFVLAVACRSPDSPPIEPPRGPGPDPIPVNDAGPTPGPGEPKTNPGQPIGPLAQQTAADPSDAGAPDAGGDAGPVGASPE